MKVNYRELKNFDEFKACASLQGQIFKLSDLDKISPLILNSFSRDFPSIGTTIGAFLKNGNEESMIGYVTVCSTLLNNTSYALSMGVLPKYQNKLYGISIMKKLHEVFIKKKVSYMYAIYDILESNLGRFYHNMLGFYGMKYEQQCYELSDNHDFNSQNIPIDKVLMRWDINSKRVINRLKRNYPQVDLNELLNKYTIVDENMPDDSEKVLMEIPVDFLRMKCEKPNEALKWRLKSRLESVYYLNKKNYIITECIAGIINNTKKIFYLLEKN